MRRVLAIHPMKWVPAVVILGVFLEGSVVSCSKPVEPQSGEPILATVVSVKVPETARAGRSFSVSIVTDAPNGCWTMGHDEVRSIAERHVSIDPYDRFHHTTGQCADIYLQFRHNVKLTLFFPGTTTISIRHRIPRGSQPDSVATMEKEVVVW